jgi:peptide/nickel transport system substrate-binding protein
MRKISWAIFTSLMVISLVLTACGGGQPASPSPVPPTEEAVQQTEAAPEPTAAPPTEAPTPVPPTPEPPAEPKQLVFATTVDIVDMDPARAFADTYLIVGKAMYDQLTELDPQNPSIVLPGLAEKWEISADGLEYTFFLRKGVTFATGRELVAKDVKYSLERLKNLKGNPSFLMDGVNEAVVVDDYTVKFLLAAPDASFLARTAAIYMAVIDSEVAEENGCRSGADADTTDTCKEFLDDNSIGSGPYTLERWTRNTEIRLVRNESYWRGQPAFETIILQQIEDATTQSQMIQQGDADIAMNIDPDTAQGLEGAAGLVLYKALSPSILYLAMNTKPEVSELTSNQKFRQAVSLAIDYQGMNEGVLAGNAVTPHSILPEGLLGADTVPPLQRDVEKAKALLAEAGFGDGVEIDVHYANQSTFGVDFNVVMQKLQADLAEVGITVNLFPEEFTVWITPYRAGELALTLGYQTPDFVDSHANTFVFAGCDGVFAKRMAYCNPVADQLVKDGVAATDPAQRAEVYKQLLTTMNDDAVFLGFIQPKEVIVYRDNVTGFAYSPVSKVVIFGLDKK